MIHNIFFQRYHLSFEYFIYRIAGKKKSDIHPPIEPAIFNAGYAFERNIAIRSGIILVKKRQITLFQTNPASGFEFLKIISDQLMTLLLDIETYAKDTTNMNPIRTITIRISLSAKF